MRKIFTLIVFSFIVVNCFGQGVWTQKTDCSGSARYRAISFAVNGKCYMGTGATGGGISLNLQDLWEYDVIAGTWSQKADLIGPKRTNATASSANGYGYVGLGSDNNTLLKDWYQYDPVGNTWTSKASFPGLPRFGAGAFTINDMIYCGGGLDSASNPKSDFYVYDAVNDMWTQKASMTTAVACMAVFTIGQQGYFVAGLINGSIGSVKTNQEYDVNSNTWTTKAFYPPGNTFSAIGFAVDNHGYVGTGFTGSLTDVMYRYDPVGDAWTQETSWPTGIRQWAVSCVSGNKVFVGTGNSTGGQLFNDWWEFTSIFTNVKDVNQNSHITTSFNSSLQEIIVRNSEVNDQIKVYDVTGKLVFEDKIQTSVYTLSWNKKGIFIIAVGHGNNSTTTRLACM